MHSQFFSNVEQVSNAQDQHRVTMGKRVVSTVLENWSAYNDQVLNTLARHSI